MGEAKRKKALRERMLATRTWTEVERAARFICVDCGKDTSPGTGTDEYYSVYDHVWEASGLAPNGGMLCLDCLGHRIGRPLTGDDFTCMWPSVEAWRRYQRKR